jgi:hypothetical protein
MGEDISRRKFMEIGTSGTVGVVLGFNYFVIQDLFSSMDLKTGNANEALIIQSLKENRFLQQLKSCVAAPVLEEIIFRLLPSKVIDYISSNGGLKDQNGEIRWDVGIPVSLLFSGLHNIKKDGSGFSADVIPLQQFIGGLVLWYLQRKYGVDTAITAHATHNSIWIGELLSKM